MNGPGFVVGLGDGPPEGELDGPRLPDPPDPDGRMAIDAEVDGDADPAAASRAGVGVPPAPGPSAELTRLTVPYSDAAASAATASAIAIDPTRRVRLMRGRLYMIVTVPATRRVGVQSGDAPCGARNVECAAEGWPSG